VKNRIKDIFFDSNKGKIKLSQRASIFFFCLLLSTFFWFLSALSKNYNTTLTIPLQYDEVAEDFLLTDTPNEHIKIEVSGSGFELLGEQVSLNHSKVKVDLNQARRVNKTSYAIVGVKLRDAILEALDKDLNLTKILTDSIKFKTQRKISKKVNIVPVTKIDYAAGYNLRGGIELKPDSVLISGPQESVEKVKFVNTKEIQLNNISDSVQINIELDKNSIEESISLALQDVEATIPIEKYTEKQLTVPLKVLMKVEGVQLRTYPNEVKVILIVPLSKYEVLNAEMLSASVTFDHEMAHRKKLKVELSGMPDYGRLLRIEPESVEFIVKK